jgi:alkylated DNA repair dioxygenase AlkB
MGQLDFFGNNLNDSVGNTLLKNKVKITNGEYTFHRNFFKKDESDFFMKIFRDKILWKQESMNMYGKQISFPRLTSWYGDNDKPYKFSGITLVPNEWTEELLKIKNAIEPICSTHFNSVLLNLYRDGNDSISWHTDAEPELGLNPTIASVNFGETRKFQLKHNTSGEKIEIDLTHGSLLVMDGELQHFWKHQVPKTTKQVRDRINLTFRIIK